MSDFKLEHGSRIAVIGAEPAGSFFCYFALDFARRAGLESAMDIYEPRDFGKPGPMRYIAVRDRCHWQERERARNF